METRAPPGGASDAAALSDARLQSVHAVMSSIAGARSAGEVERLVANEARAAVGAQRAVVALLSDDRKSLHLVASSGYEEGSLAASSTFPVDDATPMGRAIVRGQMVLVESQADYEAAFPDAPRLDATRGTAFVTCPLVAEGSALGALHYGFSRQQRVGPMERSLALAFANLTAQAIARVRADEQYRSVVENAPVQIAIIDKDGRLLSVNRRLRGGGPPESALGQVIYDAPGLTERERFREVVEGVMRSGEPADYDACVHFSESDERWFHVRVAPFRDGALLLTSEITRRKRDEAELALVRAQLVQGEKLAALGSLVSGVAHELRTPLTFLANNAFLAQHRLDRAAERGASAREARDEAAKFFAEITAGVDRINQLVEDLRKYTKARQDRSVATSSLHALVTDAVELFRATHRSKHPIETSLSPTPGVLANKGSIQQLVINLLQNAADASPPGAPVRVVTREAPEGAILEVIDHGTGMSPSVLARMYDPLFTTKPDGTGLGLSIVRRIVDEHRARVECESELGVGTRFRIVFPRSAAAPERA